MELQEIYDLVESCITDLGVDPKNCRTDKPGQWDLFKGSAKVMIDVFTHDNGWSYLQVLAPIAKIPVNQKTEFYEEVLEKNHSLYGVGMTKFKEWIYIKAIREVEGLDKSEVMATLNRVGNYADELDDYYKNKYGGEA